MGQRGLLLAFISEYRAGNKTEKYKVKREDGKEEWFEGTQTNDAPVKYLLSKALEDNNKIEKIICIVSQKVREEGYEEFKSMVNDYIQSREELKTAYEGQEITYQDIDYPESEDEISVRASEVYRKIAAADCIGGEDGAKIYIDYTGGLRDINFLMTAIIRYLEYHGVSCREIVYSSYNRDDKSKNKIYSLICIYDMYQLLNGVEQFIDTGNAELLEACYHHEDDADTKELLKQIVSFSHAMSLCDVRDVDKIMDGLCVSLDQFDAKEDKGSFFSVMFGDLTSIIRKKLYIERGGTYSYPKLIQWCLDNNMVQQALTLYIEKMPEFYCNEGILEFSKEEAEKNKNKKSLGQTWKTEFFYSSFYDQLIMPELKCFGSRLKSGYESMKGKYPAQFLPEQLEAREFLQLKAYMATEDEKKAVDRLVRFLKRTYERTLRDILLPYTGKRMENCPKTPNSFVKAVMSNREWLIYFFYDNQKKYEEACSGTYERKAFALDEVKMYRGKIPGAGTDDNNLLYGIMKYYLALKLIRNRINHASEQETQEDERKAIQRLEKDHGICMNIEFQNIKSLIQTGIDF